MYSLDIDVDFEKDVVIFISKNSKKLTNILSLPCCKITKCVN